MKVFLAVIHDRHSDPVYSVHSYLDDALTVHDEFLEHANAEEGDWAEVLCIDTETKEIVWPSVM